MNVRKIVGLVATAVMAMGMAGCSGSARLNSSPGTKYPYSVELAELKRDEYRVVGNVNGESCVKTTCILIFCWTDPGDTSVGTTREDLVTGSFFWFAYGGAPRDLVAARDSALYNALASNEEVDTVLSPRYDERYDYTRFFPFYSKSEGCSKVKAKGIAIKADAPAAAPAQQ